MTDWLLRVCGYAFLFFMMNWAASRRVRQLEARVSTLSEKVEVAWQAMPNTNVIFATLSKMNSRLRKLEGLQ